MIVSNRTLGLGVSLGQRISAMLIGPRCFRWFVVRIVVRMRRVVGGPMVHAIQGR